MVSVRSLIDNNLLFYIISSLAAIGFIAGAFRIHKMDLNKERKWIFSGIALAVLNVVITLKVVANRPIGASTAYPYAGDLFSGLTSNTYFDKIKTPGNWELIFLAGAFLSGVVISLVRKEFKLTFLHENWIRYKGTSNLKRILWSFFGGFILITGARMAGGCTSGHILSGGMQLAISSLLFAVFVFAGLFITGKLFYRTTK